MTTPTTYDELLAERQRIDQQLQEMLSKESTNAIETCKGLIAKFSLAPEDLFGGAAKGVKKVSATGKPARTSPGDPDHVVRVVPMKFKDPVSGALWSGRGKTPLWIKDKDREQFLIRT